MTIKDRFRSYRELILYIRQLEDDINVLYSKAESTSIRYDLGVRIQSSPNSDPVGDVVSKVADTALELREKLHKAKEERRAIDAMLEPFSPQDKLLIHLRYYNGESWEAVADALGYSLPTVYRLHANILDALESR